MARKFATLLACASAVDALTLHDFSAKTLVGGTETALSAFKGKPTLVLNVASL